MRFLIAVTCLFISAASAQEHQGCESFPWPVEAEQAALGGEKQAFPDGGEWSRKAQLAMAVPLAPFDEAKLAKPPERAPKNAVSFAGSFAFAAGDANGVYRIALPEAAWIDVIQNDQYLKPVRFGGAVGCPGVRKSVEFEIGPEPFVLQLSDASASAVDVALIPSD